VTITEAIVLYRESLKSSAMEYGLGLGVVNHHGYSNQSSSGRFHWLSR
jgi:hypothetical protein